MTALRTMLRGFLLSCVIALSGCGGGGGGAEGGAATSGGGSVDSATTTPPPSGFNVAVDKPELRFVAVNGGQLNEQSLVFSLSGANVSGTYYASAEPDANASFDTFITDTSLTSLKMSLRARPTQASVDGAINFKLCKDSACTSVVWSRALPYHIRNFKVDTTNIVFSGYQGGIASITRTITPAPAAGDLTATGSADLGGKWLSAQIGSDGALIISANGTGLEQSYYSYNGVVFLQGPDHISLGGIMVAVKIGAGISLPPDSSVDINGASPASVGGSIALAFNGNQSPAWSASSDKPWLVLRSTTGTGATALAYTIDTSKLVNLPNFASDTATVTVKAVGLNDVAYRLVVTKKLPEILSVIPNPVKAGQAATLHLHGRGFQQIGSVNAIKVNGAPLGSGAIVSDTEAMVDIGPMSAGAYQLDIPIRSAIAPTQPVLNVVDGAGLASALIDSPFSKTALVYSAQRQALYTVDGGAGKLMRYRLVGGTWVNDKSIPVPIFARIGLSHDGKTLYTVSATHVLDERDPDTLAVIASYTDNGVYDKSIQLEDGRNTELPITSDGRIWFVAKFGSPAAYFDTLAKTFVTTTVYDVSDPTFAISADGTRMFVDAQPSTVGSDFALRYDSATGLFDRAREASSFGNAGMVLSGNGNYVLVGATSLYESASYRLIGKMPEGTGGAYSSTALLSPDGSRIYATAWATLPYGESTLVRLDVIATDTMTKIGEIPLPQGVNCSASMSNPCSPGVFVMSPFGDTIFWAGSKKIAVIPIPRTLSQPVAVSFRMVR